MGIETNLWLVRHAPVDGPRGVIHGPDAPADTSDAAAFAVLKAKLPPNAFAICSRRAGHGKRRSLLGSIR
jgi:alpha-ribazole phosphatase